MSDSSFIELEQHPSKTRFTEKNISVYEHLDPDKHYIGEALPIPGADTATPAGTKTSVGTASAPARADHSHSVRQRFASCTSPAQSIPASTTTVVNNWAFGVGDSSMAPNASGVFVFPESGIWDFIFNFRFQRSSGSFSAGLLNVYWQWNSAAGSHVMARIPLLANYVNIVDFQCSNRVYVSGTYPALNLTDWTLGINHTDSVACTILHRFMYWARFGDNVSA